MLCNVNRVLIGNLNINSIRNTYDQFKNSMLKYNYIFLDYTFHTIPCEIFGKQSCSNVIKCVFIEFNVRKCGYFAERIIRHLKIVNIILIILMKPLALTATKERFSLLEISVQK